MTVVRRNAHVNIHTGERTDQLVGNGQVVDIPRWTQERLGAILGYEQTMREKTIPEIVRTVRMRQRLAAQSRRRVIY
jgi:hypothetical protein